MRLRKDWYYGPWYYDIIVPNHEGGESRFTLRAKNFAHAIEKIKSLGRTDEDYTKARVNA